MIAMLKADWTGDDPKMHSTPLCYDLRPKRLAAKDVRRLEKFQESVWKLFAYGSLVAYGIWVVHDEPWTYDSATFWSGGACPRFCREWPACSVVQDKESVKL